ncbi:hypothetical protein [Magnetospirillum sp. UT-4]|uniref:hypothetical protein n=1 Tax=Magnetospirillum sp. UT-4 TaxID=2681467 RepID=UPI001381D5D9|nr:hypothetical protein [Magnetospirillum sp. UT-4]CAA7623129.1 conserved hypothetical protein [Magnetospirillum sp. UT-4]
MSEGPRDNKAFDTKVANLIAATRHIAVPQILLLRRLTMADTESRKWATERQLQVVFAVVLSKALERMGLDALREARRKDFAGLLPPDASEAEAQVLAEQVNQLVGPDVLPTEEEPEEAQVQPLASSSEYWDALARILTMARQGPKPPAARRPAAVKEPPPLFAAQMGMDVAQSALDIRVDEVMDGPEKSFVDFPTLFDDTVCSVLRKTLGLLQVQNAVRPGRRPFIVAPEFSACFEEVLRRFVLPQMRTSRHIQTLGTAYNWAELGGLKLFEIIQGGEKNNPVLHNWDNRWGAFRVKDRSKLKAEDNPWPLLREDATRSDYEPPGDDDLQILQDLLRYEPDSLAKAWRELTQLYQQEFRPGAQQQQARDGAFRDGLMKWGSKLPEHVGEFLAIKAHFVYPEINAAFLRRLLTNFGRNDAERHRSAPYLASFTRTLSE